MSRLACSVSVCLLCAAASASPILMLSGPAQYTPGTPFVVELSLVGATGLAGFGMDVSLSASSGTAGTDYSFAAVADPSLNPAYVFNGLGPSFAAVNADPATSPYKVYVGDTIAPRSVSPFSGQELLARFTINTAASFDGTLALGSALAAYRSRHSQTASRRY